ncbi:TIM44-like domain-containing protein [Ciceribacter sp. L1K23]|uniref:TIM44-like domain-containing protein n=1 Tax=Ciceribacter sp. L1K23 TaxID=2820276 RepID=UPI001B830630|nr:TIM44-like domain-containing protein [Ciceribacter sp. L1K23]MBR0558160.1 TIM44-like domain-containing protein [Ciceribacter sp. L1K23]
MRRYGKLFAVMAIGFATMLVAVDFAEARRAGGFSGFGSRGTRTYSAPPTTRTAPTTAAPIERSMTPQTQATRPAATQNQTQAGRNTGGMFGGLAGGLMGGLLLGGLFGMLMGTGFGGGFGFLGLLLQGLLIFFLIRWAMRAFGTRQPAYAGPGAGMARSSMAGGEGKPSFEIPRLGGGLGRPRAPENADEIGVGQADLDKFEGLLKQMQAAYAAEDYAALRRISTPEAMSYLAEELGDNATRGLKNVVRDVHLVQGDIAEAWAEGAVEYATVAMRYESIDYMVDRTSGHVVSGDPDNVGESVEIWTFVRRHGTDWRIAAIQSAYDQG